jgi:hypothetical protein
MARKFGRHQCVPALRDAEVQALGLASFIQANYRGTCRNAPRLLAPLLLDRASAAQRGISAVGDRRR